jgi:hypothetical protein
VYRRSRIVAFVGLPLVMAAVALIGLSTDPADASPKGELALIFAIVGGFVFLLLAVQGLDLRAATDARATPLLEPGSQVDDPIAVESIDLLAALAIRPVGEEAARAHADLLGGGGPRSSLRTAWIICALIFTCVPMSYLLETVVPILVGAALIAVVAVFASVRALGPGGTLERGYADIECSVEPLGLQLGERPAVTVGTRAGASYGPQVEVRGALRFTGERHGRAVTVEIDSGASEVRVAGAAPVFEAKARDGKVRGKRRGELPAEIERKLAGVPASPGWRGVSVTGGPEGILVRRKPVGERGWLPDLWLAERLARAAGTAD